jgi:uncharacterized membrane protein
METLAVLTVLVGGVAMIIGWSRRRELQSSVQALIRSHRELEKRLARLERNLAARPAEAQAAAPAAPATAAPEAAPSAGSVAAPPPVAAREVTAPPAPPPKEAAEGAAPPLPTSIPPADWPFQPPAEAHPPEPAASVPPAAISPAPTISPAPAVEPPPPEPSPEPLSTVLAEQLPEPPPQPPPTVLAPGEQPSATGPAPRPPAPPPVFVPREPPPPPPPSAFQRLRDFDWERLIGVKLYSILAGIVFVIAAALFVKLNWDLFTSGVQMSVVTTVGLVLILLSETRWAQRYRLTLHSLGAAGVAALFATFFAAYTVWHLITSALACFGLLALVAAVAVLLSIRRSSLVIAMLGLLGGFATPILVSTGENQPFGLFGYLLLLNAALAWVAYKKRWPILSALSLLFTVVYQGGWAAKFLDRSQLPIAIGVFLVFPLVGFVGIALGSRRARAEQGGEDVPRLARLSAIAGALPPSLLALYVSSSAEFAEQWPLVLGFAVIVAAGLAAVAAWQGPEWLHLAGGATVLAALAGFLARTFDGSQWPLLAAFLAAFVAVYLGAPLLLARLGRDYRGEGRLGALAAPLVLSVFVVVAHVPEATPLSFLVPLLVLTAACAGHAVLRGDGRVHVLAGAMAIAGQATWSGYHLGPGTLYPALLGYAAFAAVFLGGPFLAERRGRPLAGAWPGPLALASLLLLFFPSGMTAGSAPMGTLVGITVIAALLQSGLFARARGLGSLLIAAAGVMVGFLVLTTWAGQSLSSAVLPALLAVSALAGVALAGGLLAPVPAGDPAAGLQKAAPHLALAGYLFISAVACQRDLALVSSGVPWLALTGVLDLGFLAAALLRRRPDLLCAAAAGSIWVILAHEIGLGVHPPAPAIGAGAAIGTAVFFLAAYLAARRTGLAPARGLGAAGSALLVALHGGQLVLWTGALGADWLPPAALAPAHVFLGAALLALAWMAEQEVVALTAALAGCVAAPLLLWHGGSAAEVLWLATPAWLLALAYPLLRGTRGRSERLSFLGSVLASGVYLLVARKALVELGAGGYLGALPVVQAALLVPHLRMLLRMEPPSQRDLGRLALVAAAVLGLLTVAVPLQLDKQWWTIGWALLAAALAWLWRKIPHRGLLGWSGALLAASFVRLVPFFNWWIFDYHARGQTPVFNWYLYTYALVAGAHFAAAWFFSGTDDRLWPRWPRLCALAGAGGAILVFFLLNVEIADFWSSGEPRIAFRFFSGFGRMTSYTVAWAAFAGGLALAFRRWRHRGLLGWALALLAICFLRLLPFEGAPQLDYRGAIPILNWYLLAYGAPAGVLLLSAWLLRGTEDRLFRGWPRSAPLLVGGGILLLFFLVNVEIADFFGEGTMVAIHLSQGYRPHLSYTVFWTIFAVALVIAFRRTSHPLLLWGSALLLLGAFLRLFPVYFSPLFDYDRRGHTPILNGFLLAYLLVAAALFAVFWLLRDTDDRLARRLPRVSTFSLVAGVLVVFFLVNVEIADYWSVGDRIVFRFSAGLGSDLTYTIAWAIFAVGLLVAGILFDNRGTRVAAIVLLTATAFKACLHDLWRLSGMYRIASLLGLCVSLVVVALLIQRFVLRDRQAAPPSSDPSHPEVSP